MQRSVSIQKMTSAALLIALGIVIPMFMPLKVVLEPASFTLASHVPVMLAMFISPAVTAAVAVGTTLGFFLGGFPIVVVLRAATHLIFAVGGALYLKARPQILNSVVKTQLFSLVVGIIHGVSEVLVVSGFYASGGLAEGFYAKGFVTAVVLLVGVGSIAHSMVDFLISLAVLKVLGKQTYLKNIFSVLPAAEALRVEAG